MKEEFVFKKSLLGGFKRSSVIECIEKLQMEKIEITGKMKALEKKAAEKDEEIKELRTKLAELEKPKKEADEKPEEKEKKAAKPARAKKAKPEEEKPEAKSEENTGAYCPPDLSEINEKFSGKA